MSVLFNRYNCSPVIMVLLVAIVVSAFAVVYVKDLNRRLFIKNQQLQQLTQQLTTEHGRLLLEQSAWSAQARVERLASERLGMIMPRGTDVVVIKER